MVEESVLHSIISLLDLIANVEPPGVDINLIELTLRFRTLVVQAIDVLYPLFILFAAGLALITFLIGYFEYATSINPYSGCRRALRGGCVFIGLVLITSNIDGIEQLFQESVATLWSSNDNTIGQPNLMTAIVTDFMSIFQTIFLLGLFCIGASSMLVLLCGLGKLTWLSSTDPERRTTTKAIIRALVGILCVIMPLGMHFPTLSSPFVTLTFNGLLLYKGRILPWTW